MSMNREWMRKLENEETLSMSEAHALDEALSAQTPVGDVVGQLENDAPSLAWRSQLNEKLFALSAAPAPKRFQWWRAAGFGTATAALALVVFISVPRTRSSVTPVVANQEISAEQVLLDSHRSTVFALSTGAGDGAKPLSPEVSAPAPTWTEAELEAF